MSSSSSLKKKKKKKQKKKPSEAHHPASAEQSTFSPPKDPVPEISSGTSASLPPISDPPETPVAPPAISDPPETPVAPVNTTDNFSSEDIPEATDEVQPNEGTSAQTDAKAKKKKKKKKKDLEGKRASQTQRVEKTKSSEEYTKDVTGDPQEVRSVFQNMYISLAKFGLEVASPLPRPQGSLVTSTELQENATLLSHEVVKFNLFLGTEKNIELLQHSSEQLMGRLTAVLAVLRSSLSYAGPTLRTLVEQSQKTLLSQITHLVEGVDQWFKAGKAGQEPAVSTAAVPIDSLDKLHKLPTTNRMAVGKQFLSALSLLKDAKSELMDLKPEFEDQGASSAESKFELDDDWIEYDDDGPTYLSAEEWKAVPGCKELAKLCYSTQKTVYTSLVGFTDTGHSEQAAYLEDALKQARDMSGALDTLGSALEPPQSKQQLREAVKAVAHCLATCLNCSHQSPFFLDSYTPPKNKKEGKDASKSKSKADSNAKASLQASLTACSICSPSTPSSSSSPQPSRPSSHTAHKAAASTSGPSHKSPTSSPGTAAASASSSQPSLSLFSINNSKRADALDWLQETQIRVHYLHTGLEKLLS
eukprot:g50291.t1